MTADSRPAHLRRVAATGRYEAIEFAVDLDDSILGENDRSSTGHLDDGPPSPDHFKKG